MTANNPSTRRALRMRVFLASPGDVQDERALALRVLQRLPSDPLLRNRLVLETVAWDKPGADTPMLATLTPQEAIAQQRPNPSECDVVVVIFWSRMGTPLPEEYVKDSGAPYLSGTEWEYLEAKHAAEATGRPKVLIYRRTEKRSFSPDDPDFDENVSQWRLVQEFFDTFRNKDGSIRGGVNEYDTPDTFEKQLTAHLREIVGQHLERHEAETPDDDSGGEAEPDDSVANAEPAPLWPGSPFPGLRAFRERDAPIYFGRGRETDALLRRLARGDRFVAVVGASGSGKSSLVAAGLFPRLRDNALAGSRDWLVVRLTPGGSGEDPFLSLAACFKSALDAHQRRERSEAQRLCQEPEEVDELVSMALEGGKEWSQLLLFVDQFEELFTVVAERHRDGFCRLLAALAHYPRARVVVTLRADFYHRCVERKVLAELLRAGSFPLSALDPVALEEMISRPAERAGLVFEPPGLPERILAETGDEPGALPLLAFALSELYETGKAGGELSAEAYDGFGGVRGAIGQRAESTFIGLDPRAQAAFDNVFRELVEVRQTEGGWVATRRRSPLADAAKEDAARELVGSFVRARLLVQDEGEDGKAWVEVAHEALLRNWERMVRWIDATGEDLWQLRELGRSAGEWDRSGRKQGFLWPRARWRPASLAVTRLRKELDGSVQRFLSASRRESWRKAFTRGGAAILVVAVLGWLQLESVTLKHFATLVPVRLAWVPARLGMFQEPETVRIEAGAFRMGCLEAKPEESCPEDELPVREVAIAEPFHMGKYEVTIFEYLPFAYEEDRDIPDTEGWWPFRRPVVNVSWTDAKAYVRWLAKETGKPYDLPSEAEWEYAARAGSETRYFWGDDWEENRANCRTCGSPWDGEGTAPIGSFRANPFGLHDMYGNVWEWVLDCKDGYASAPTDGAAALGSNDCPRVLRGGSWRYGQGDLRAAYRFRSLPYSRDDYVGFRVVCRPQSSVEC